MYKDLTIEKGYPALVHKHAAFSGKREKQGNPGRRGDFCSPFAVIFGETTLASLSGGPAFGPPPPFHENGPADEQDGREEKLCDE